MAVVTGPPPPGTRIKQRRADVVTMATRLALTSLDDVVMPRGSVDVALVARLDTGRWIADCDNEACGGAELVNRADPTFYCLSCFNYAHGYAMTRVVFPDNADEIEEVLLTRPHTDFMSWFPGDTIDDLINGGPFHRSWTAPRTWTTGEIVTASILNTHVRDNLLETAVAKVTTAGDWVTASAATALQRTAKGTTGSAIYQGASAPAFLAPDALKFLRFNAAGTALEAAEVPTIISADAFEWGTKAANRYTANFASHLLLNNAVFGDLLDVGWVMGGGVVAGANPSTPSSGDLDAADDAGQQFLNFPNSADNFGSPKVIGGKSLLDDIEFHTGTRPTKVTVRIRMRFADTADGADVTGVGIGTDPDGTLAAGGAGSNYMFTAGATNFELWNGAAATDLGVAKDTNVHNVDFEITFAAATYRVLLDGVERKAAAAITQDFFPMCIKAYQGGLTSVINLFGCGVKYE